jgi:hypothetical protein
MFGYQRVTGCAQTLINQHEWQPSMGPQSLCQQLRHLLLQPTDKRGWSRSDAKPDGLVVTIKGKPCELHFGHEISAPRGWNHPLYKKKLQSTRFHWAGLILIHNHQATAMLYLIFCMVFVPKRKKKNIRPENMPYKNIEKRRVRAVFDYIRFGAGF